MPTVVAAINDIFFLAKVHDAVKGAGAALKMARTAAEAVEAARDGAALVLLDLNDRGFDPLELARALRAEESLRAVPVVAFLSHVQAGLMREAQEVGLTEVLPRSVFSSSLPAILGRYIS